MLSVTFPSVSNDVSRLPADVKRSNAKSDEEAALLVVPPHTILPSGCRAIAKRLLLFVPIVVFATPLEPNVLSCVPVSVNLITVNCCGLEPSPAVTHLLWGG